MKIYPRIVQLFTAAFALTLGAIASHAQTFDVPLTNQFVAMYGCATSTTVPTSAWTIINFDSKEVDTNNAVTTGSTWKFTAPDTAYILINVAVEWASVTAASGDYEAIAIFKNGVHTKRLAFQYKPVLPYGTAQTLVGSTILRVQPNDIIDVRVWHTGSSSGTTSNVTADSWITISRVK